jgi:hypothetical protein
VIKLRQTLLFALLVWLGGVALADDTTPQPATTEPAPQQSPTPATVPAATPPPAPATAAKSPETFTPSEEISEDLSVSFPVDI